MVIHLAATVGGIGANQKNPARFFYENAIMGIQLLEYAARSGVEKFVCIGTVCSYPKFTPVPFQKDIFGMVIRGNQCALRTCQEDASRPVPGVSAAVWVQCDLLIPVNLYGPGDNFDPHTSHVIRL